MNIMNITFDCSDASTLAAFWASALRREVAAGATRSFARIDGTPGLLFFRVPETKVAKNRVHLDLSTGDLEEERERVLSLGAEFVHEQDRFGVKWHTFRDPGGNEFCVVLTGRPATA